MKRAVGLLIGALFCGVLLSYGVTEEVPVGRVSGHLTMKENGKPLADAVVTLSLIGAPEEERPRAKGVETKADGTFAFPPLPAGPYNLDISANEHHLKRQVVMVEEGKVQTLSLEATPNDPHLSLYASQRVFTPDETPKIELQGFVRSDEVKIAVYRLDVAKIAAKGGLQETLSPLAGPNAGDVRHLYEAGERVADLSHRIVKRDAEGAFIEPLTVGKLAEGFYFITCTAGDKRASTAINVSNLALVTKSFRGRAVCYTTGLASGQPASGVEILGQGKSSLESLGKTDAQGSTEVALPPGKENRAVLVARQGKSIALVGFFDERANQENVRIVGYCERPAYRPGDEIQFKGIVRRISKDGYLLPGAGTTSVTIQDPDGNPIQTMSLPISEHGTFHGSFTTSPESKPGGYDVKCKAFGAESSGIYANVVAYRKPEYSVEVTSDRSYYVMGDTAAAAIECRYYYGGPVVGAKVKVSVFRSPAWQYEGEGEEAGITSSGAGEYSEQIDAVTDASGRAHIEFPTRVEGDPSFFTNDYVYNVSASVTEEGGKYFDGQGEVRVVRGDHDLTLEVQNPIIQPGETVDLLLKTTDAVKRDLPSPNHMVTVEVGREVWTKDESVFVPREKLQATTGADGTAHLRIPVDKADSLTFRATSRDAAGREVVAEASAYVEGSPAMAERLKGSLAVTLDHREYSAGSNARVLIQTDLPGGSALVCVQGQGVLWRKVIPVTSSSTLVTVPIVKDYAPNVWVSVAYIKNKKFLEADKRLKVARNDHDLRVEVKSDRDVYKPGDTARVTVRTFDSQGRPKAAEVSLGVVDEGIYAIAQDATNIREALYPDRSEGVVTSYSFPEIYLDGGDKGSSKVPLRTKFKDTAGWLPTVWTGARGEATVPVPLPDNLTEWRVTAVGVSDATDVGMTTHTFRARKELMVRLQLPQYLVDGDRQRMTVVVANDTGQDQDVNLNITAEGLVVANAGQQRVHVPNGKPQTVEFDVTAGPAGVAAVTARAWIDQGPNDGVRQSFPIAAHGRPVLNAKAGEGNADFTLPILPTADPKAGSLKITLSPTLAGDLVGTLDRLIGFPYGCTEQTMSRFLPSVLAARTIKDLGLPEPEKLRDLPRIVRDSVARLEYMKHGDGGWGWWEYDESNPFMTALVLDGLDRAKRAGYDTNLDLTQTLNWGMERLKTAKGKDDRVRDKIYLAYALLRHGKQEAANYLKSVDLAKLSPDALANAALAFHEAGDAARADAALGLLVKSAQGSEGVAYWPPEDDAWGAEPTALTLVAFETIRPEDPIVPRIVRHLMTTRKGDMWESTRDTSYSLVGLTAYLSHTKELNGNATATVRVNGKVVGTVSLDPRVLDDKSRTIEIPRAQLGSEARIEIQKVGDGACYYSTELRQFDAPPVLQAESTDPGLKIERRYYRLEPRRLENGTMKLLPSPTPVDSFRSGELVRVELVVNSDVPRQFVMIEEPTPSSCRVQERDAIGQYEEWGYWWSRTVIRDDRIAFFATWVPKGVSKISYTMRAEQAGRVRVLPTRAANMYDPATSASTAEATLEVAK
ncbi:MG2 domain-containing protein [Fimbriimonas ginsengisoli]|uniref:Alpha-2-macroglobulin domain protein n=1 Tax=Fimbriimonas ginsengisoli Gsoil 348 TaxID=661478 RepID=A0A068NM37_FIMGI|nr:MG2 domain-containing protein [Fimbriimonas ginsengisoli]AIE84482.1 alpha-2-macroglobulin domain protein [Fimbriimonas ginsengisoli Gsoil 348]